MTRPLVAITLALTLATLAAGCAADGAKPRNFTLQPQSVGWYAGEDATFQLTLTPTLTRDAPSFHLDRRFAIEEIRFNEQGVSFGGDHTTRNADTLNLQLRRDNETNESYTLDLTTPSVDIQITLPAGLRDSVYTLEIKLFQVGWIKSDPFRVVAK